MTEQFLLINNIRTHVTISGTGKPLLLVHGLGGPQMWDRVIEPFSKSFRVIVLDLPGFGESDSPPHAWGTPEYATFLKNVCDKLRIDRCSVAGISYGGQIAATFAARFPGNTEKLILICSTGLSPAHWLARGTLRWKIFRAIAKHIVLKSRRALEFFSRRSFYKLDNRPEYFVDKFYEQMTQPGKRDAWLNGFRNVYSEGQPFRNLLSSIGHPTLIIWGKEDHAVPVKYAAEFQRLIPDARVQIFPECAHSVPLEKSGELCEVIGEFVFIPYPP